MTKEQIADGFSGLQEHICKNLSVLDEIAVFSSDDWERAGGGGGTTRTIKEGAYIEKGGVAFSEVHGPVTQKMSEQLKLSGKDFFATGVSVVLHSRNVTHPIIHMNVRYFEIDSETYWFGGGIDLTPIYINKESAKNFHIQLKQLCDRYDKTMYPEFKKWADRYFHLPHRKETRGIGGIFFEYYDPSSMQFDYVKAVGMHFNKLIHTTVSENKDTEYTEEQRQILYYKRGRYVEFNLLYDRGTRFGLKTGGDVDAILMSLPPKVEW